jgi:hypothetical protein
VLGQHTGQILAKLASTHEEMKEFPVDEVV